MLRNTLGFVAQARTVNAPSLRMIGLRVRFKSDSSDASGPGDTKSAQSKLDQLASYLENQPQESAKTVSRSQRLNQRKQSASAPRRQEQIGPTKSFQNGQYYDPYTLNPSNMTFQSRRRALPLLGPSKREAMQKDPIHILGLNPAKPSLADDTYKNGPLLSEFVTEMGKIQPRNITGLTRKSQRYVGKAIRRARSLGILPVMSRGRGSKGGDWR